MKDRIIWWIAAQSEHSRFYRFLLNLILSVAIPFNAPHGFRVYSIAKGAVGVKLPNKRVNRNHVNSIHACVLAALCEYVAGLAVMTLLEPSKYRMVLKSLNMEYHYRAKGEISCLYNINTEDFVQDVIFVLDTNDSVLYQTESKATDLEGNVICTGRALWQIKKWSKVKSK
ncbi:MAG: PaaI family thioesterase [Bacteroidota bacterium]